MGRLSYQSQVTNTSSQDSIQDGLSPDMSDYDHSSELDNDPREIHIPKTSSSLGEDEGERRERENGRGSVECCEHRLRRFTIIKRPVTPCHVVSCREDRNGFCPLDVATRHRAMGQCDAL